jgi:hypothetical protein
MSYQIAGLCGSVSDHLGSWEFSIKLFPAFKTDVKDSGLTRENIQTAITNMGRQWLDSCGFDSLFEYDGKKEPLYKPEMSLRVTWGEWGPEHISVPGNACGLDIGAGIYCPRGGRVLYPHNVDSMRQAMLLLAVFTWIAEMVQMLAEGNRENQ